MYWYDWDYYMENWESKDMDEWGLVHIGWDDLGVNVVVVVYGIYRAEFLIDCDRNILLVLIIWLLGRILNIILFILLLQFNQIGFCVSG